MHPRIQTSRNIFNRIPKDLWNPLINILVGLQQCAIFVPLCDDQGAFVEKIGKISFLLLTWVVGVPVGRQGFSDLTSWLLDMRSKNA